MKLFGIHVPFTQRAGPSVKDDRWFTPSPFVFLADGTPVTPETALRMTAVFGCVRVISQTLAALPLLVYQRRADGGKDRATKHPLYKLLRTRPNRYKTSGLEFREMLTGHALLYGNGYAQIIKNRLGEPLELVPLHPTRTRPDVTEANELVYKVRLNGGAERVLAGDEVFHIRAFRDAGLEGISPIAAAEKAIRAGLSLESFGMNFFEGGAVPGGVLEYPGEMSEEAKRNLRESWERLHGGENRGRKTAVLEGGVTFKPQHIPQTDAQFLEQRKFQVTEICRIYGVPPHLLADLDRATFSNIEEQNQNFIDYCLLPWFRRWEEAIARDLLDADDSVYFAEFLADGLLRGNSQARSQAYALGRQWGWYSINEIRTRENLNPIGPEGDVYLSPLNMVPAGDEGGQDDQSQKEKNDDDQPSDRGQEEAPGQRRAGPAEDRGGQDGREDAGERVRAAFRGAFRETWARVVRKEVNAVRTAARKKGGEFDPWFDEFLADHRAFAVECLRELARSYCLLRGFDVDMLLPGLADDYRVAVRDAVAAWQAEPGRGYDRREDEIADYWTERLLGYSGGGYESAA